MSPFRNAALSEMPANLPGQANLAFLGRLALGNSKTEEACGISIYS